MSQITLTVPLEKNALLRASEMLSGLASDYSVGATAATVVHTKTHVVGDRSTTESTTIFQGGDATQDIKVCDHTTIEEAAKNLGEVAYQNQKGPEVPLQPATAPNVEWIETRADGELTAEQVFGGNAAQSATVPPVQPEATASTVPAPVTNDSPPPVAPPVTEAAATTSTNTTTATASNVELDSEGLPWDARIHSGSKTKLVKDGSWKLKRGLDEAFVNLVKEELKAVMNIPAVEPTTVAPPVTPNAFSVGTVNALVAAGNGATAITPASAPATSGAITTFADFMPALTKAKLDSETVKAVLVSIDPALTSLPLLASRQDLIPQVAVALGL